MAPCLTPGADARLSPSVAVRARFSGLGFSRAASGPPLLDGAVAHLECRVTSRSPIGDHLVIVGEVISATVFEHRPLLYYRGGYTQLER